ncbi:MAG TPA: GIY-YIG nuclease family protein [Pseudomonadales bacterium]|nr:GIY-YIG nuclease family protein [Pseudomonadales bacterium]
MKGWYVYIIECADGSLYTGITTDVQRREREHNDGKLGARYTRSRRPVRLVYSESQNSRSTAAKREYAVKRMTLSAKRALILAVEDKKDND